MAGPGRLATIALASWLAMVAVAYAGPPESAPPVFVSVSHALTFRAPSGTLICPLPKNWVGADHGTMLFLVSPGRCGEAGFPSGSRSFDRNTPRIEVYYQYWLDDPPTPPPRCKHPVGSMSLFGKARPLCQSRKDGMIETSSTAGYMADSRTWVEVSLQTPPNRLKADIEVLKQVAASIQTCRETWSMNNGRSGAFGVGKPCPIEGKFF